MKVVIFPRYDESQATTRVRVIQYLPYLEEAGISAEVFPILSSAGISGRSGFFSFAGARIRSYYRVWRKLFGERGTDSIIHIHCELFPFIPFWLEYGYLSLLGKKKYIIELDDAWFHRYDANSSAIIRLILGEKINFLMKNSALLIAGNQYIADRGKLAGAKHIEIIPTVVDVEKYKNYRLTAKRFSSSNEDQIINTDNKLNEKSIKPVIGWIGSPATTKFLLLLSDVIRTLDKEGIASFVAIGADPEQIKMLPIRVIQWSEQVELETLHQFDIGIMPLIDSLFERGKCGFKIIQYMASSLPVVASPVGANRSIVLHDVTGFLASTDGEWIKCLSLLCSDQDLRQKMGKEGMRRADELYSLKVAYPRFVKALKSVSEN
jgi:glycosyltransferase involved in cell wall biosynthesis